MQNKIMVSKEFNKMETSGDATSLLKEIRRISLEIETDTSVYDG